MDSHTQNGFDVDKSFISKIVKSACKVKTSDKSFMQEAIAKYFIEHSIDFKGPLDANNNNVLHLIAIEGPSETIRSLMPWVNAGVDPNEKNSKRWTASSYLAEEGRKDFKQILNAKKNAEMALDVIADIRSELKAKPAF